jgi:MFS family permease
MQEPLVLTLISIIGIVILGSFFTALLALFPKLIQRTARAAKLMHGRTLIIGILNVAFFAFLTIGLGFLSEQTASSLLQIMTMVLIGLILIGLGLGLAAMALLMGEQIVPQRPEIQQIAAGSGLLILSSLTPYLGWFLLLPYLFCRGVGGLFLAIFRRKALDGALEEKAAA